MTDHGEFLIIWPWENSWEQPVAAAESTYDPGTYVTLWGFEWCNPVVGHIKVMNKADFTSVFSDFELGDFYDWIVDRPEAFGRFDHPGGSDHYYVIVRQNDGNGRDDEAMLSPPYGLIDFWAYLFYTKLVIV